MFFANNKGYVVNKDEEKIKVSDSDDWMTLLAPDYFAKLYSYRTVGNITVVTNGVKNLSDQYYCQDNLFYLDKDWKSETKLSNIDTLDLKITGNGQVIYYKKWNSLYKIEKGDFGKELQIAKNVLNYGITSDGKKVYYIDSSGDLWYQKGTKEAKQIAGDVYSLTLDFQDRVLFMTDYDNGSGILYSGKKAKEKKMLCDDVMQVIATPTVTYYYANDSKANHTMDLYGANRKTDFSLIIEGIQ